MNKQLLRLGVFATLGIIILVGFSFYVNDQPFWYRACNAIDITVDDATGLRRKSPVKTLGLDIGYIKSVDLDGENVVISVCITAQVRLRSDTRAYVRSIGVLGDRFLELKPVDVGPVRPNSRVDSLKVPLQKGAEDQSLLLEEERSSKPAAKIREKVLDQAASLFDLLIPSAQASEAFAADAYAQQGKQTLQASRETEISDMLKRATKLIDQLTLLTRDLRDATSQASFKELVVNLNEAAKNLAQLLEPKGELTKNLRKSMESFRKSLESAEEALNKINTGKGSIGKLLNDEKLYDEAVAAIKGLNLLLGKAGALRVFVDLSADQVPAFDGGKGRFYLKIEPNPTRYYLLGISTDPRGAEERTTTTTITSAGTSTEQKIVNKENGIKFTFALGKYFGPLDLKVGLIENAGTVGVGYWLDEDHNWGVMAELYKEKKVDPVRLRVYARAQVFMGLYLRAGVEDIKRYQGPKMNSIPYFFGAGLYFNDEDIKYLLAFK